MTLQHQTDDTKDELKAAFLKVFDQIKDGLVTDFWVVGS
jgi:hypothetical protein